MFVKFAVLAVAMLLPTVMVWGQPCQPSSPAKSQPIAYSAVDLEVRESVFRELLRSQSRGSVCFISFGPGEKSVWVEPPAHFLERLADLKLELKPVSGARFPTRSDVRSPGRSRRVEDKDTGKPASIFYVVVVRWHSDSRVEVSAGRYGGLLNGGGFGAIVENRDGSWRVVKRLTSWVS